MKNFTRIFLTFFNFRTIEKDMTNSPCPFKSKTFYNASNADLV